VETRVLKRQGFIPRKIGADEANRITGPIILFRFPAENIPVINYIPVITKLLYLLAN
jgi:hypothetical protein